MTSSARRPELRVAVFARAPVPGEVKTRLAPLLGADGAARLHCALVRRALATARDANVGEVDLWCMPDERHPFFGRCAERFGVSLHRQQGADLGERMVHAFERATAAHSALLLIGSDCPALTPADLQSAATALESHDAVFTPAEDGGYVLAGFARAVEPSVFRGVTWGSATVMAQTRRLLDSTGTRWAAMPTLWDVDRPEDYARLQGAGLAGELVT